MIQYISNRMSGRLQFFAASAHKAPTLGTGELGNPRDFLELGQILHWRRVLSNFYIVPGGIEYEGLHWNTVEHGFQGMKFRHHSVLHDRLSLESNSEVARGDGQEARRLRKAYILSPLEIQAWDILKEKVMMALWREKFTKDPLAKKVLLATGIAELWHCAPRMKAERWIVLEQLREEIRNNEL